MENQKNWDLSDDIGQLDRLAGAEPVEPYNLLKHLVAKVPIIRHVFTVGEQNCPTLSESHLTALKSLDNIVEPDPLF